MIYSNPLFWLIVAFGIFIVFVILKYTKSFNTALNTGIQDIQDDIEQATQLLEDAKKLLAKRRHELEISEKETLDIQANIKEEIKSLKSNFQEKLNHLSKQLEKQAHEKILKTEHDAFNMIKNTSIEIAIHTAMQLLEEKYKDGSIKPKDYISSELKKMPLIS